MVYDKDFLNEMKRAVRVKSDSADQEIVDLIDSCENELKISGVCIKDSLDPLSKQAIKLYCKAHYGYDENTERFRLAYASLRDAMALSGEYKEP